MSAPGRRSLVCSVGKLSASFQRIVLTRVRLSLRKGEGEGAGWLAASGALSMARTPHLDPLPLAKASGETNSNGTRLIIYQPQVDDWKDFQQLTWRMAVSLTPKSGKEVLGVVEMKGHTDIDNVAKVAIITNPQVTGAYFPSLDQVTKEKMEQL